MPRLPRLPSVFRRTVLVVGAFRSGTNLMKHLLETHYSVDVVFSRWFWKHGLPPTRRRSPIPRRVPIVVMTRNPVDLNLSLYNFWCQRRPTLIGDASIGEFVRSPLIVNDPSRGARSPFYRFASPTDYWNALHHAWMHWPQVEEQRIFVKLEDLGDAPAGTLERVAGRFALAQRAASPIRLPAGAIQPTSDGERTRPGAPPPRAETALSEADRLFIRQAAAPEVMARLEYR